ncbi:MAG TPA: alpha/beta hydrolase [Burkholderiaceae bacterium]|nr:alpha/beta hydrolase [Burkholderiaceae bacterium]HMX11971.1 alpha/beta hydrolase [Burkholderiaceae bacterium]HMZ01878.1 alpha/beta hydrolase [Burkholderiaceae bacterium]HNB42914.1 alpha/beta hydrolase [Burkholderiaceae bacterium]HNG79407.1 alpha/beta hydrolase [Burkholderiaceae bacterium]
MNKSHLLNPAGGMTRTDRRAALARLGLGAAAALVPALGGCSLLPRSTVVPMPLLREPAAAARPAETLVVMLPGRFDRPQDFVREGLVGDLKRRHADVDVLLADAHLGYYMDRSVLERLRQDVIGPARRQGYRQIWLAGISLGGFGALGYAARHAAEAGGEVDGVLAIAPYLGSDEVIGAIGRAGGARPWLASPARLRAIDLEQDIWQWLAEPPAGGPPVFLGFGRGDRMGAAHRLAAGLLPSARVMQVDGGHDWAPWRALWQQWLAQGPLAEGTPQGA